jgi:hypothetical protein
MTRQPPKIGDRVRVTGILPNDPDPLEIGEMGTVDWLSPNWSDMPQIGVDWDSGRALNLLPGDPYEIVQ